jgi:hypothetical protein
MATSEIISSWDRGNIIGVRILDGSSAFISQTLRELPEATAINVPFEEISQALIDLV